MGATMYYLLTGAFPFDFPAKRDPIDVVLNEPVVPVRARVATIPKPLAAVIDQAVKRNAERFPEDFRFPLSKTEAAEAMLSRSQVVTLKRGQNIKYLPHAFTEHGVLMAANVLNSPEAVKMSV